jgi:rhodanese-related sulfurtransferase
MSRNLHTTLVSAILTLTSPIAADEVVTPADLVAEAKASITEVDVSDAQSLIEDGALIIDVREPQEFNAGHLPGAINIPRGVLEFRIADYHDSDDPDQTMVVYCRSGSRSALAVQTLQRLGYGGAVSMTGGYRAWGAQGLEGEPEG